MSNSAEPKVKVIDYISNWGPHPMTAFHPQYQVMLSTPPAGYEFHTTFSLTNNPDDGFTDKFRAKCKELDVSAAVCEDFIKTRHPESMRVPVGTKLMFLPTLMLYFGNKNFCVYCEDYCTLQSPYGRNGITWDINFAEQPYMKCLQALMEMDNFKGIMTHVRSNITSIKALFGEKVGKKTFYVKLGYPPYGDFSIIQERPESPINFLFTNSYGGVPYNFVLRGGLEAVAAFKNLYNDVGNAVHLTLCGTLGMYNRPDLLEWAKSCPAVTINERFISDDELHGIFLKSHALLLPAVRIHSTSLIKSMFYGTIPIVSDGWAFDEFVENNINGFICTGQQNKTSWIDELGIFREKYDGLDFNQVLADNIYDKMKWLVEHPSRRKYLAIASQNYAKKNFSVENRNALWAKALETMI